MCVELAYADVEGNARTKVAKERNVCYCGQGEIAVFRTGFEVSKTQLGHQYLMMMDQQPFF